MLVSDLHEYRTDKTGIELVREALANPVGAPKLSELSAGKDRVVIIASDHTRPVPSKAIIPPMLDEIRRGNPEADIVITTNGGYPLDQNIYQAVKGMTAAEATVNPGGVIIMLAKSNDGHGGEQFYRQLAEEPDIEKTQEVILARDRSHTLPDQWQVQVFIRVLKKANVIYLSDAPDEMIRSLHMIPAHSLEEALQKAEELLDNTNASVTAIPDGISVIVAE